MHDMQGRRNWEMGNGPYQFMSDKFTLFQQGEGGQTMSTRQAYSPPIFLTFRRCLYMYLLLVSLGK